MAFSKASSFEAFLYKKSFFTKAMAHPARIHIILYLLENGLSPFHDICRGIPLAKTTTSQHLRQLRQSGIIKAKEKFPRTFYLTNPKVAEELFRQIGSLYQALGKYFPVQDADQGNISGQVKNG
jgi:DNA-binding transcriptional ArsR family regulator